MLNALLQIKIKRKSSADVGLFLCGLKIFDKINKEIMLFIIYIL